jgi:hypothetical protein
MARWPLCVAFVCLAHPGRAAERTMLKLAFEDPNKSPLEASLVRNDERDGSLVVKLLVKGAARRAESVVLYSGGVDDDGPGSAQVRNLTAKLIDLPKVGRAVRVDFSYQLPGSSDEQTDTTLIGIDNKPHKLLELTTHRTRARGRLCHIVDEREISTDEDELEGLLLVTKKVEVQAELDDEDAPIDKSCVAKPPERKWYRYNGDSYRVLDELQPSPGPQPFVR